MIQVSRHGASDAGMPDRSDIVHMPAWPRDEFEAKLRERGRAYHIHHPFNVMLNSGRATPEQVRGWVAIPGA